MSLKNASYKMFKLFILFSLIFSSLNIFGQEYDDSYLASLPSEVRKSIEDRVYKNKTAELPVYRSSNVSSDIKITSIHDSIFGSDFFNTLQTSFMPINEPNLDDKYILDFGDVLNIQFIGQSEMNQSFNISRDGSINLPDIGKLFLSGLSLREASKIINTKVKDIFIGVDAYITLTNIRDVSVMVSGAALNPGIYTLSGNSNLLHAIHVAGGINNYGSLREIKLIRNNKTIESIDIYDILIKGSFTLGSRLRTGDMIFVEPRKKIVTVDGSFKRPGKYELTEDQVLSDAITYAIEENYNADLKNIFLYRFLDGEIKSIAISNLSQFDKIKANNGDRIYIREHSFRNVNIDGSVLRPGTYLMNEGDTLNDLIAKAGGYTNNAYPFGAIYLNKEAKKVSSEANTKLHKDFMDNIVISYQNSISGLNSDITPLLDLANQIKDLEASGRVVIDIDNKSNEVRVMNEDYLFIPEKTDNVYIFGEIHKDGAAVFKKDADLGFYLSEAAGLKETADSKSIYIVNPNGRTQEVKIKRNIFAQNSKEVIIYPGSIIYVPRKIDDKISRRLTTQAFASIVGNIGVSLASISVLKDK